MANASSTTTDHELIRGWAEQRGGKPSHVKRTGSKSDVGILRIDFPGYSGEDSLDEISWEQWFEKFEESKLAFLYEDDDDSRFNKLISRDTSGADRTRREDVASPARSQSAQSGTIADF